MWFLVSTMLYITRFVGTRRYQILVCFTVFATIQKHTCIHVLSILFYTYTATTFTCTSNVPRSPAILHPPNAKTRRGRSLDDSGVYIGTFYSFVFPCYLSLSLSRSVFLSLHPSVCHVVPGEHEKCGEDVSQISRHRANELCSSRAHCCPRDTSPTLIAELRRVARLARHVQLGEGMSDADDSSCRSRIYVLRKGVCVGVVGEGGWEYGRNR